MGLPTSAGPDRVPEAAGGPADRSWTNLDGVNWSLVMLLLPAITATLAVVDPRLRHWFVIPVTVCGVLIGVDAVAWLRRQFDIFDPQGLLALLGFHFFYLAPILHVTLDYWPPELFPPADWREALGTMAALNAAGLALYRWLVTFRVTPRGSAHSLSRGGARRERRGLLFDERSFQRAGLLVAAIGMAAFVAELVLFGGVSGFLAVMTQDRDLLIGMGWMLIIAESFPLTVFMLVIVRWRRELAGRPGLVALLLVGLALVQFLVAGLRGSRSSTVWPVLLGLILVHLVVTRIPRKTLMACGAVFVVFMYIYGFYKDAGVEVIDLARGSRTVQQISSETGRDLPGIVLGDLGRADIQALVLDRLNRGYGEPAYGVTYVAAATLLVPHWVLPVTDRPLGKVYYGTTVMYGPGVYDSDVGRWSTRVYGLSGEAMLNFGPIGAVAAFVPLGLLMRRARRLYARAREKPGLPAKLLAPALGIATVLLLSSDLDNIVFFLVQRFAPIAVVVFCALVPRPRSQPSPRPSLPVRG